MFKRNRFFHLLIREIQAEPEHIFSRIVGIANNIRGKLISRLFGTTISDTAFLNSLKPEFRKKEDFVTSIRTQNARSFFIHPAMKNEFIVTLQQISPQAASLIIQAADAICDHRFDLLGSGPVNLGWPIDWHADFKSGFRWDPQCYFADIRPAPYPGGYDLKVPWELSRCQHFAWLGQAYWLTGDEKYTREFRDEIKDWVRQNPPELGVNWACSMDIAIRAVNWLWGYAFFQDSSIINDDFRITFYKALLSHGRHIMANLEKTNTFTGNHYLANIVGLVYLGILLPEFKEAQRWRSFGLIELEREMLKQVYPDGGNYEASTSYHRLVTELFLSSTLLAQLNGHRFGEEFMGRLGKMLDLIQKLTKPDGTVPIFGDQDNGRLHRLKVWAEPLREWLDFRSLLAIGAILFERVDWGKAAEDQWEEAIWFYGKAALTAHQRCVNSPELSLTSSVFEDSGLYVLRADEIYIAVDLGSIGQNGLGGHAHNDALSFELFASGQTWIQDPGTYVYTADYEARNIFRATAFHNTVICAQCEQNSIDANSPFSMKAQSIPGLIDWYLKPNTGIYLSGELRYMNDAEWAHVRSIYLDWRERALVITDSTDREIDSFRAVFHFASDVTVESIEHPYRGVRLTNLQGKTTWLFSVSSGETRLRIFDGWISESYGTRKPGMITWFERDEPYNKIVIIFQDAKGDITTRVGRAMKNEKIFLEHHGKF